MERGTFKDLKRQGGVFARLLEEQNRYMVEKSGEQSIIRSAFVQRPPDQGQLPVFAPQQMNAASQPQPVNGAPYRPVPQS